MNLFIVNFRKALADGWGEYASQVLNEDDVYVVSPHSLIVRLSTSDPELLRLAFNMGEDTAAKVVGSIFRLNGTYTGYDDESLWQWLAEARGNSDDRF